jgi:hypothetical protein
MIRRVLPQASQSVHRSPIAGIQRKTCSESRLGFIDPAEERQLLAVVQVEFCIAGHYRKKPFQRVKRLRVIAEALPEIRIAQQHIHGSRLLPDRMVEEVVGCRRVTDHGQQIHHIAQQIRVVRWAVGQTLRKVCSIANAIRMPRQLRRQQPRARIPRGLDAQGFQLRVCGSYLSLLQIPAGVFPAALE